MFGSRWNVLLVEEFERGASAEVNSNLKRNLSEQNMPERLIVIATSNDASGPDEALLQRFEVFPFSAGPTFAEACKSGWPGFGSRKPADVPMPLGMEQMGWRRQLLDAAGHDGAGRGGEIAMRGGGGRMNVPNPSMCSIRSR